MRVWRRGWLSYAVQCIRLGALTVLFFIFEMEVT